MVAYVYRMPSGIPGDVSRKENSVVETQILNASLPFSAYGLVGKMAAGKFVPFAGGEAATDAYGVLVRPFPTNSGTDGLGTATPPTSGPGDVLRRGYITVKLNGGATVAAGGPVYVLLRAYGPGPALLDGLWTPPPAVRDEPAPEPEAQPEPAPAAAAPVVTPPASAPAKKP
ncbi:structural cement protein Gp24 [Achromobacter insuavis]|uniref:structural cement protein Gp24 n=1 Tax=Achromobacter insuavis TaxID=1287735 RepID=UPI003B9956DD